MNKNEIKMSPSAVTALIKDERGMSTVEYVILLAVIVVGAVTTWNKIGDHVKDNLLNAEGELGIMGNEE